MQANALKQDAAMSAQLRVVVIAPSLDGADIGEVRGTVLWLRAMSRLTQLTVLSSAREGAEPLQDQLPDARVVTWPELKLFYQRFERVNAMAKPGWPLFAFQARRWIKAAQARGETFDIAHQMLPQAMRHASPLRGLGIPFAIGPLGGGLETPEAFAREVASGSSMASKLRRVDSWRLAYDPRLRASYRDADLIIGVGPYIADALRPLGLRRFEAMHEIARPDAPPVIERSAQAGQMTILHVGRIVRTKGLRDTIRALAHLRDLPDLKLISAGEGEDRAACEAEIARLGLQDRVTLLGKIPRDAVEKLYHQADVFCFPSFREPLGGVLLEAMANGLPIITAARGGPDFVVDESCGIRVPVTDPDTFAADIAQALRDLAMDPARRLTLGTGARTRTLSFDTWDDKAARMEGLYRDVLAARTSKDA